MFLSKWKCPMGFSLIPSHSARIALFDIRHVFGHVRAPGKAPRARRSTLQYPAAGPAPATFQQIDPPKESPNLAFLKLLAHPILALGPGKSALEIPDLGQNEPAENRGSSLSSQRSRAKHVPHMYPFYGWLGHSERNSWSCVTFKPTPEDPKT